MRSKCAVEIQTTLKRENEKVPPERRMEFRIGVNLGDVMVDGAQIYGDGVNVDGAKTPPLFSNARQFKNGCAPSTWLERRCVPRRFRKPFRSNLGAHSRHSSQLRRCRT